MTLRVLQELMPRHTRCTALTLVELVVSMTVTSTIILAIGSAMLIAARAVPDARSPTGATVAAAGAVEQMITELQYAVSVDQRSANMIEFAVADRDSNDTPEVIRYEWSGTPGDPLTRRYNAGTFASVLADVREFNLSYDLRTTTTEIPLGNESPRTTLVTYSATKDLYDYPIKDTEWYAEYFMPGLPADAVSWSVTSVVLHAKTDGPVDGQAHVQLQLPTVGKCPSGVVLEEKTLLESTLLSSYLEQEFQFSGTTGLSPEQGLSIVVKWIANGTACKLWGRDKNVTTANTGLYTSSNRGVTWVPLPGESLLFTVYGTVTTAGEPQVQSTYYLDEIAVFFPRLIIIQAHVLVVVQIARLQVRIREIRAHETLVPAA